ncbi:MAG: MerC domain-containing protein [Candidatus Dadabacteria bacterium]|nr:MerC domain-containing protein [Candidatus Dadabacteria bacterium]MCY4261826.1 MerC domain-containing protein [Candidatus Dadabacteria bacterium]
MMNHTRIQRLTDYTSISLAGLCAVHCFLTPVVLILFPILGSTFMFKEIFHELMLFLVIPASLVAIFLGCRRHKDFNVIVLGVLGLGFLVSGAFVTRGYGEYIFTFIGAFIMISGHLRNFRLCRKDDCYEH